MIRTVLDTSILVKSIFKPLRSLSAKDYARELETHEKCAAPVRLIEERDVEVHIPKVCVVETAAVVRRLSGRMIATRASQSVMKSYSVVDEDAIFDIAWDVALETDVRDSILIS